MESLTIRNFRCFSSPGTVPLRPLTILVGENSTGKSSFLAAVRLAWDFANSNRVEFNEEPFLLGAYDQIAHYRGGRGGRASTFELGFNASVPLAPVYRRPHRDSKKRIDVTFNGVFRRSGSHPEIARQSVRSGPYELSVEFSEAGDTFTVEVSKDGKTRASRRIDEVLPRFQVTPGAPIDWRFIHYFLAGFDTGRTLAAKPWADFSEQETQELEDVFGSLLVRTEKRPIALAPVRTRPQRTYNPVSESPLPEGEHVPMVLAKTYFDQKQQWSRLKESLDRFGEASGLFSSLEIKGLGRHESDPFQIRLKINGPPANLIDVGYGVSQVLPILVDTLIADRGELYLLQQPEVHLHPRAQAELGSFLAELVAARHKRFIVETHSDYLLDRLRIDVREKRNVKPEDVSILFFERQGVDVRIHPMEIDALGNLVSVPIDYRRFFLDEERRFLGV